MVRAFLKEVLLLSLPIGLGIMLYAWSYRATFPAPRVTNNLSLNEKLQLYKQRGCGPLDIMAVGSSMTLRNLSSRAVIEHFGDVRYLNFGTWGFGLKNTLDLTLLLEARTHARTVLVCTNLMEFSKEITGIPLDTAEVADYLWHESELMAYLLRPRPSYYLRSMEANRIRMNDPGNYEYLRFDAFGGSTLDVLPERRDPDLWVKPAPANDAMIDSSYQVVAALGLALHRQHTHLIWLHSPFRPGLMNDGTRERVRAHVQRLRDILEPMGHQVLDTSDRDQPDSLYSDYSHFNTSGAYAFSTYALGKLTK